MAELTSIDFRLAQLSLEIALLEDYIALVEGQIQRSSREAEAKFESDVAAAGGSIDEAERDFLRQERDHGIDFVIPRVFRGPMLVSLFAVYETGVTEVSRELQEKHGQGVSLDDIRGRDFLDRARKYFQHVLSFDLCRDDGAWQGLKRLSVLRNAIAHTNGRLDLMNQKAQTQIREWERQKCGVDRHSGYLVVDAALLSQAAATVRDTLGDLVERYKQWDDETGRAR